MACGHFSDSGCVSAGKKRGFCRLRRQQQLPGHFSDSGCVSAGKKRGFCRLRGGGQRQCDRLTIHG
jgi:hypothetical protein